MTSDATPLADSVRLALPAEASSIAALQRRAWSSQLPPETADALLADITVEEMTSAWEQAIMRPPQARYRVLVAVADHRVVGFATTIPSPDPDAVEGADGQVDEFVVDPPAQRLGHGSRLLNACVDTLRADGFTRARWWANSTDDAVRRFLTQAGWGPDGGWREIGTDDEGLPESDPPRAVRLKQIRMHTDITAET